MTKQRIELSRIALQAHMYVRTYSPGDGVTHYRFFKQDRCALCLDVPGLDGLRHACKGCNGGGWMVDVTDGEANSYFGPSNGIYTALGIKEALAFANGAAS